MTKSWAAFAVIFIGFTTSLIAAPYSIEDLHQLVILDLDNETYTQIGEIGHRVDCLVFSSDGVLYGIDGDQWVLVSIDPSTGAGSVVGPLGIEPLGNEGLDLAKDEAGRIWMIAQGALYTIDRQTGAATLECELDNTHARGLAYLSGQGFTAFTSPTDPNPGCSLQYWGELGYLVEPGPGNSLFYVRAIADPGGWGTIIGRFDPASGNAGGVASYPGIGFQGLAFPPAEQQQTAAPIPAIDWRGGSVLVILLAATGIMVLRRV